MAIWLRFVLLILLVIASLFLSVPFLIPVPPLQDVVSPENLADPDSRFVELQGVRLHYKTKGQGQPIILLLHGFGASTYSWEGVMEPLARQGTVIAYDRVGFGLTERPLPGSWGKQSPYDPDAQVDLLIALLDSLNVEKVVLIGHSAGGTTALAATMRYPERVQGLVLVAPAIYNSGAPRNGLRRLLGTPQMRRLGPLLVRSLVSRGPRLLSLAWHDPSRIMADDLDGYLRPFLAQNWDVGLWELTLASRDLRLYQRLADVRLPVLVITGDDDRIVPTAQSVRLAGELPDAEVVVIPQCGHLPHEERPEPFLRAAQDYLQRLH